MGAAMIEKESKGDFNLALDLLGRFQRSLESAVRVTHESDER